MSEVLVHVMRGDYIESRHHGDLVIVDREGKLLYSVGDPHRFTLWRSSAKPFQAVPFVEEGGMEKYDIAGEELALMTSSHGGEEDHVEILRKLLLKINMTEENLDCGASSPMYGKAMAKILSAGEKFKSVNNPCSGKHTSMLALAKLLNLPIENYIHPDHPIQKKMLETIAQACGLAVEEVSMAIDGCGVPVFGMAIDRMALAYAKLSKPEGYFSKERTIALRKILYAMTHYPYYVAGTDRLDTVLMKVTNGRIVAKLGAEAVYCIGVVDQGIGICLKIDDGGYRAIDPVIIEVLNELKLLSEDELEELKYLWRPPLKNHRKEIIGGIKPVFEMKKYI